MSLALVTGGAGFIGSHLVDLLQTDGWSVRVLDDLSTGNRANIDSGAVDLVVGDVRDYDTCESACRGANAVFHLAAIASVQASIDEPRRCHDVNVTGTLNMLDAARKQGVRRFVFSSSAAVYGNADTVPTSEDQPLDPQSPYAAGKLCGEVYCETYARLYGIETVSLRYFNVFGPRQRADSGYAAAIPAFVGAAVDGRRPTIFGDGCQTRDFVYVGNVARANVLAACAGGISRSVFNIGSGEQISLLDLVSTIEAITGKPLLPHFAPARAGEVRYSCSKIERAMEMLSYAPAIGLKEGLAGMIRLE